jgi:hypothetical protein
MARKKVKKKRKSNGSQEIPPRRGGYKNLKLSNHLDVKRFMARMIRENLEGTISDSSLRAQTYAINIYLSILKGEFFEKEIEKTPDDFAREIRNALNEMEGKMFATMGTITPIKVNDLK